MQTCGGVETAGLRLQHIVSAVGGPVEMNDHQRAHIARCVLSAAPIRKTQCADNHLRAERAPNASSLYHLALRRSVGLRPMPPRQHTTPCEILRTTLIPLIAASAQAPSARTGHPSSVARAAPIAVSNYSLSAPRDARPVPVVTVGSVLAIDAQQHIFVGCRTRSLPWCSNGRRVPHSLSRLAPHGPGWADLPDGRLRLDRLRCCTPVTPWGCVGIADD
jgi:hypothetical protein